MNLRGRLGPFVSALKIPFPGDGDFGSKENSGDGTGAGCKSKYLGGALSALIQVNDSLPNQPYLSFRTGSGRDMEDRYWVALFKEGGESGGVERELARGQQLDIAYSKYKQSTTR